MKVLQKVFLIMLLCSLFACGGSGGSGGGSKYDKALLAAMVDNVLLPSVAQFKAAAESLDTQAGSFCAAPDMAGLTGLQTSWENASKRWHALALYNFGPLDTLEHTGLIAPRYFFIDALRVRGLDYSGSVQDSINSSLGGTETLDSDYFRTKNFDEVGLLPLEYVLFREYLQDGGSDAADMLAEFQNNDRKCAWLQGLTAQLASHAQALDSAWNVQFAGSGKSYRDLFVNAEAEGISDPLVALIVSVQAQFDYLKKRNAVSLVAPFSGYNFASVAGSVDQLETLLQGSDTGTVAGSVFAHMNANGASNAVDQVKDNIASARTAIQNGQEGMLNDAFGMLDGNLKREIPNGLDINLGINFTDGD